METGLGHDSLRRMLLAAIPEMREALCDSEPAARADAEAFLAVALRAIDEGDLALLLRCVRVSREIGTILDQRACVDIGVSSAWWRTSMRIPSRSPKALSLIEELPEAERAPFASWFRFPNRWLRERVLFEDVPAGGAFTLGAAVERRGDFVRQAGASNYARMLLRFEPMSAEMRVIAANALPDDSPASMWALECCMDGIANVVREREESGRAIRSLRVSILELEEHDVDSRESDFARAARIAFDSAVEAVGLVPCRISTA